MDHPKQIRRSNENLILVFFGVVIGAMLLICGFAPVIYDTAEFGDTFFIVGAGWRDFSGLRPNIDFNHFYGGTTETLLSWSYSIFGPTLKAFDYALVLLFALSAVTLMILQRQRLSRLGTLATLLLVATLAFTRFPMEHGESITRLASTHSFLYNRIGFIILILAGVFVALPSDSKISEIASAMVVGALLIVVALTKPTFVVLIPAVLVALLVQTRWVALLTCVAAAALAFLILDPGATRWLGSYNYIQASVGERADAQIFQLIRKAVQLPLAHPIALAMVLTAAGILLALPRRPWTEMLATMVLAGGGLGMATTMGGGGVMGQLALPIAGLVMIVATELAQRYEAPHLRSVKTMTLVLVVAFALPHLANQLGTTIEAIASRDRVLIQDGPLANYLSVVESKSEGEPGPGANQYPMLADGLAVLRRLGDMSDRGIIADNGITFEFGMLSKPVPGYPLWPRAHSPELAANLPLPPNADMVLIGRGNYSDDQIGPVLRAKLDPDFVLCTTTPFWEIFARAATAPEACSES